MTLPPRPTPSRRTLFLCTALRCTGIRCIALLCIALLCIAPLCCALFSSAIPAIWAATPPSATDTTLQLAQQHPQQLVRSIVRTELAQDSHPRLSLRYRIHKVTAHTDTTKEIIETQQGDVACLVATAGQPLSPAAAQVERARLQFLRSHPALQTHRRLREQADTERFNKILRALPDAFRFTLVGWLPGSHGKTLRFTFQPNPNYHPDTYETRALPSMRGELWINARQRRMEYFHAVQFQNVDFGWGILGRLDKNGSIELVQSQVVAKSQTEPSVWALTHLHLALSGRALLVKPVQMDVDEIATDYHRLPAALNYLQAVDLLLQKNCSVAATSQPLDHATHPK